MKNKLNIAIFDLDDIRNPLLSGGQAAATFEIGKHLVKRGHKVTVYCSKYPKFRDRREKGIYYRHIGIATPSIKLNNLIYIAAVPLSAISIKADIILECFTAPISTLMSPLFTRVPVVGLSTSFDAERFSKKYHLPLVLVEKFGSKFYKYFIALNPHLARKMKNYNPRVNTRIIEQGVSEKYLAIKKQKSEHILFLGRLDVNQKGIDLLLASYASVAKKIKYPLVIAGDGPDKARVEKMIKNLDLTEKVRMVGYANDSLKRDLFSKAKFVVFPSRNEGFSVAALEAVASGNRLVTFDIPSFYWAHDDLAIKTKAFNIKDFAKAMAAASESNKRYVNTCREFAKDFLWEKIARKFEMFFNEVVKEVNYGKN